MWTTTVKCNMTISMLLERAGHTVVAASDGRKGLARIQRPRI